MGGLISGHGIERFHQEQLAGLYENVLEAEKRGVAPEILSKMWQAFEDAASAFLEILGFGAERANGR